MSGGGVYGGGGAAAAAAAEPGVGSASSSTSSGISNPGSATRVVAAAEPSPFTAEMRDRQARGKDPYDASSDGGIRGGRGDRGTSSDWSAGSGAGGYRSSGSGRDEPFAVLERRRVASQVLDSPELLMMAAQRDDESIPATRLRYTRMLCGIEEPSSSPHHHHHHHHQPQQQQQQQPGAAAANRRKSLQPRNASASSGGGTPGRKAR